MAYTPIDNGLPCVIVLGSDLDIDGTDKPEALEAETALRASLKPFGSRPG